MRTFDYTIQDKLGIHARPAGLMVREAARHASAIVIAKGETHTPADRIFGIMKLGARCGDTITITVEGEDEDLAAEAFMQFLQANL